jgi:hypothetical protein
MNPTFRDLDVIEFVPITNEKLRIGDIIVIMRETDPGQRIIHRIVAISTEGIRTRGDNNKEIDHWILKKHEIEGRVIKVLRKGREIPLHLGYAGYLEFLLHTMRNRIVASCIRVLQYPYRRCSHSTFFSKTFSKVIHYRIVTFSGSDRYEAFLYFGPFCAGYRKKGQDIWEIRPPFGLLIHPSHLPSLSEQNQTDTAAVFQSFVE